MDRIMSTYIIYYALYLFVHFFFSVFEFIQGGFYYVNNKLAQLCRELNVHFRQPVCSKNVLEVSKTPKHVTILMGSEEPCYQALANLVIWCLAVNIPYISFYDYKGALNKNQAELEYEIEKKRPKECSVIWHNDPSLGHKNGFSGRKIHVKLLSDLDGKNSIVNVCKKIALRENTVDLSIELVSEELHKHFEFPEPDLGLICGEVFSLFDYPPWQMSLTEFVNLKSHHNVTFEQFVCILCRYSKREQRLGK